MTPCRGQLVLKSDQYKDGADEKTSEPHLCVAWQQSQILQNFDFLILTFFILLVF